MLSHCRAVVQRRMFPEGSMVGFLISERNNTKVCERNMRLARLKIPKYVISQRFTCSFALAHLGVARYGRLLLANRRCHRR
jgi:hypothetical protein